MTTRGLGGGSKEAFSATAGRAVPAKQRAEPWLDRRSVALGRRAHPMPVCGRLCIGSTLNGMGVPCARGRAQAGIAAAADYRGNLVPGCGPRLRPRLAGLSSGRCCGAGEPLGAGEFHGDVGNAKAGRLGNVRLAGLAALVTGQGVVGRGVLRDDGWSASVVGIMPPIISRGFRGRREGAPAGRVPPGQYVTRDFPVLSAGPTPHTPLERWDFTISGEVDEPRRWTWEEFRALPAEEVTTDIHCVTKWSKLDTVWQGVRVDTLLEGIETSAG